MTEQGIILNRLMLRPKNLSEVIAAIFCAEMK